MQLFLNETDMDLESRSASLSYAATVQAGLFSSSVVNQSLRAFSHIVVSLGLVVLLVSVNYLMMIISAGFFINYSWIVFAIYKVLFATMGEEANVAQINMISAIEDMFNGIKQIRINNYIKLVSKLSRLANKSYKEGFFKSQFYGSLTQPISNCLYIITGINGSLRPLSNY